MIVDGSGVEVTGLWSFLASVGTVAIAQAGIMWRSRRVANRRRTENPRTATVSDMENKDSRAFKFLVDRLDMAEKAHRECEIRTDDLLGKMGALARKFDLAIYSMDVLKAAMEQGGIKLPPLPMIERS